MFIGGYGYIECSSECSSEFSTKLSERLLRGAGLEFPSDSEEYQ